MSESGHEYPKHRPDKHGSFRAVIWQINSYLLIRFVQLESATGNVLLTGSNTTESV